MNSAVKFPELGGESAKAYAIHVAKLGGYLDQGSDPPPGWETMWKRLQKSAGGQKAMKSVLNEHQSRTFSEAHRESTVFLRVIDTQLSEHPDSASIMILS